MQSASILLITFTLYRALHDGRATGQSGASHYAKQYSSRFQGVFSLQHYANGSRLFGHHGHEEQIQPVDLEARRISPRELMRRPLPFDRTRAPRLLHQSWKSTHLPPKFERWSSTCRKTNPDWEYVLWSDRDNYELVKKYVPWFLQTYKDLKTEIYRADAMRNVYMHVFGGCA